MIRSPVLPRLRHLLLPILGRDPTPSLWRRQGRRAWFVESLEDRVALATFFATNPDDVIGVGSGSLRQAILDANAHPGTDTIVIDPGSFTLSIGGTGEDVAATGDLDITDPVTITGSGAGSTTIDAHYLDRAFQIIGVTMSMSGVTIENGRAAQGGGISNDGGSLTIVDCTISGNHASYGVGGGIANVGAVLAIRDSTISGNGSSGAGASGGGIANVGGVATIDNSTISGNEVFYSVQGGGISNEGGSLTIRDSAIAGNSVWGLDGYDGSPGGEARGGGIASVGGALMIDHSTISGNRAIGGSAAYYGPTDPSGVPGPQGGRGAGGGLYYDAADASLTLHETRFSDNRAIGGIGGDGGFGLITEPPGDGGLGGAGGVAQGGGLYLGAAGDGSSITLITISGNQAIGGAGGGGGVGLSTMGPPGIIDPARDGGLGGAGGVAQGGGLCIGSAAAGSSITLGTFTDNRAIGGPGGPGGAGGNAQGLNAFHDMGATAYAGNGGVGGTGGAGLGGGLYDDEGASGLIVTLSTFGDNQAIGGAGGAGGAGGTAIGGFAGEFSRPSAPPGDGFAGHGGFGGSGGWAAGGGLYGGAVGLTVTDSALAGNHVVGGAGGPGGDGGDGIGGDKRAFEPSDDLEPPGDGYGGDGGNGGDGALAAGGGLYGGAVGLSVVGSTLAGNHASGGDGGVGGALGDGIGGQGDFGVGYGQDGGPGAGGGSGMGRGGGISNAGPSVGPSLRSNRFADNQADVGPDVHGVALQVNQVIINGGAAQRSNVESITVLFNQTSNLRQLVDDGSIVDVARIVASDGRAVALSAGRYHYDAATGDLTIDLTIDGFGGSLKTLLADGRYQLRLQADAVEARGVPGNHLLDTDGTLDGEYRADFFRLLGDFDGDESVTLAHDRPLLLAHFGTRANQAGYDFAFDLNGDGVINIVDYLLFSRRLGRRI